MAKPLSIKDIHLFAKTLPHVTMNVQWGDDHVFKVAGKMFLVTGPAAARDRGLSFKATEESFAILTKVKGIEPAPYLARAKWVKLATPDRLSAEELREYIRRSHALVAAGLTKKLQRELGLLPA